MYIHVSWQPSILLSINVICWSRYTTDQVSNTLVKPSMLGWLYKKQTYQSISKQKQIKTHK